MVYFIQRGSCGPIKIGSSQYPEVRIKTLQSNIPEKLEFIGIIPGMEEDEIRIQKKFAKYSIGNEWFKPSFKIIEYAKIKSTDTISQVLQNETLKNNFTLFYSLIENGMSLDELLESLETYAIEYALIKFNGSKTKAAEDLKISFRSIRYRVEKLNINMLPFKQ